MKTLYSDRYKLEFYHIPKNAMTSIIKSMEFKWTNVSSLSGLTRTFCVLRNPITRMVSSYLQCKALYRNNIQEHNTRNLSSKTIDTLFCVGIEEGFNNYITEIEENGFFDNHNLPQIYYLNGEVPGTDGMVKRGIDVIDYYLDFDQLTEEINNILGIDIVLHRRNVTNNSHKGSLLPIAEENKERILNIYPKSYQLYVDKILKRNNKDGI